MEGFVSFYQSSWFLFLTKYGLESHVFGKVSSLALSWTFLLLRKARLALLPGICAAGVDEATSGIVPWATMGTACVIGA